MCDVPTVAQFCSFDCFYTNKSKGELNLMKSKSVEKTQGPQEAPVNVLNSDASVPFGVVGEIGEPWVADDTIPAKDLVPDYSELDAEAAANEDSDEDTDTSDSDTYDTDTETSDYDSYDEE